MSQIWDVDQIVPASTSPATDIQRIIDGFNALRSVFSGTVEPASADQVPYMFWADTTTGLLKQRNAANSAWITLGTMASANLGLLPLAGGNLTGGINAAKTTVASAATPDIFAVTVGNTIDYTGTATATGFAAAPQAGAQRLLVCAAAAVFTAGANMLIDGITSGSNFTAAAGDKISVIAVTTTQFRLTVAKASGAAVVATLNANVVMFNGRFTVTMAANAVTIALKGNDGNDPSATNAVVVVFRSATLTDGSAVTRTITSALSTVISSGSTGGTVSAIPSRVYIHLIDNAGTVELAWSQPLSSTTNLFGFSESGLVSTTAEGGAGAADSSGVMYSTTARTAVAFRTVGYFESTQATAGTWATAATVLQLMGPGVPRTGDIAQTRFASSASGSTSTATTMADVTNGSISITPTSAVNLVALNCSWNHLQQSAAATNNQSFIQVLRGAVNISGTDAFQYANPLGAGGSGVQLQSGWTYLDAPASISATTYKLQHRNAGANAPSCTTAAMFFTASEIWV